MSTRRDFLKASSLSIAGLMLGKDLFAIPHSNIGEVKYVCKRPPVEKRQFKSEVVERPSQQPKRKLKTLNWPGCLRTVSPIRWIRPASIK